MISTSKTQQAILFALSVTAFYLLSGLPTYLLPCGLILCLSVYLAIMFMAITIKFELDAFYSRQKVNKYATIR